jgi:D-arabinose 1-dehydrogenase-like Zn-dependent alcohol dehydrogenase
MVQFTVFKGSKEGVIVESTTTKELGHDEVLIKVTHSGLCGTDEHYKHADMVLGHEGAGVVKVSSTLLPAPSLKTHNHKGSRSISQDLPQR